MVNFQKLFLDIFFPRQCIFCNSADTWLCEECLSQIVLIKSPTCPTCKKLTPKGQFCSRCRSKTSMTGIMVAAYYEEGPLKNAITNYKYKYIAELSDPLSDLLINHLQTFALPSDVLLVPVPLHRSRLHQRGFNQSAILAQKVAEAFGLGYEEKILVRNRKTKPQVELSGKARRENVKGAFTCQNPEAVFGRNILLIDDVCTTGATLDECAKELKKNKASQVWGLVLARQ